MKMIPWKAVVSACTLCSLLIVQSTHAEPPKQADATVEMVKDFELIGKLEGLTNHVYGLAFSADGKRVAAGDTDGFAHVWSFPEGKPLASFSAALEEDEDVAIFHAMALSENGEFLYAGDDLGRVHIWDVDRKKTIKVIRAHGQAANGTRIWSVYGMDLSPDGKTLVTCGADDRVRLWDVPSGEPAGTPFKHRDADSRVSFAPDGKSILVGGGDRLWEIAVEDGKVLAERAPGKEDFIIHNGLTVEGTGKIVVSQYYAGSTRVFARPGLKELRSFGPPKPGKSGGRFRGNDIDMHPNGRVLAAAYRHSKAKHGLVVLWDVTTGEELKRFEIFFAVADNVRFSPDGRYLVAAGADRDVAVFGLKE